MLIEISRNFTDDNHYKTYPLLSPAFQFYETELYSFFLTGANHSETYFENNFCTWKFHAAFHTEFGMFLHNK